MTEDGFRQGQKKFLNGERVVDEESGLMVYVPQFEEMLKKIRCPVLAIFGEKDTNVDWRKTAALYRQTIGANKNADLTIKTFPDGNHNIQKCETGGYGELLKMRGKGQACEGYYESMLTWTKQHGFAK